MSKFEFARAVENLEKKTKIWKSTSTNRHKWCFIMKIHYFNPVLFPYSMIQDGFPILKWYFMSLGTNSTISSGQKCTNFEIEKSPGFRLFFYFSSPIFPIFFTHFPHFLHPFYPFSAYCIIRNMLNFKKSPKSSL